MHIIWLLKHARLGIHFFSHALKVVVFDHKSYWLLCTIIAVTQMLHFTWLAYSDVSFSFNKFIKAFFEGQDILEELQELFASELAIDQLKVVVTKTVVLFVTSLILMTVHVATAYASLFRKSQYEGMQASIIRIPVITTWAFVETFIFLTIATRGYFGAVIFVSWQLATSFVIPLIADNAEGVIGLIKSSWLILKKKLSDLLAGDLLSEFTFFFLGAVLSALHAPDTLPDAPRLYQFTAFKMVLTFGIIYFASIVVVAQTIFFTKIYQAVNKSTEAMH